MKKHFRLFLTILVLVSPTYALATNGMNMIGYGAVSSGMGGADLAVVENASAMNINPAGICSCEGAQVGAGVSVLMPKLRYSDVANEKSSHDNHFPLPLLTYVTPVKNTRFTIGIGAFAQGGMGVDYDDLATPFLTNDKLYSNVGYMKVTPTVAWKSQDGRLRLGASLHVGQVNTEIEYFPDTVAGEMFSGFKVDELVAYGYGLRLGFQYEIDDLTIGGSWLSKTELDFEDGDLVFAYDKGTNFNAKMKGFGWPKRIGLGFAYRFNHAFRIAADIDWIEWSQAVDEVILSGGAEPIVFDMSWDDQWVLAVGAEWEFAKGWLARIGYNHGNSPVPDKTLSTLFPAIVEDHAAFGLGYHSSRWKVDFAYEHGFENKQTNSFTGATETHEQRVAHFMVTWVY